MGTGRRAWIARLGSAALAATLLACLLVPSLAQAAKEGFAFKETFGSAAQPSLGEAKSLARDASGDLYVADSGRSELQRVAVTATAGKFKLRFKGETTAELPFNASVAAVGSALQALPALAGNVEVFDSLGKYGIKFKGALELTDVEQIVCESGSPPLSGGGCSVETSTPGTPLAIKRFKPDGTPDDFSALGTNAIDGKGGADETPQHRIAIGAIAVDSSGTATDGDIYIIQSASKLVDVFAPSGAYLGQITGATSNEAQKLELTGFSAGDEFSLEGLPGSCSESHTAHVPFALASLGPDVQSALEAKCGANFAASAKTSLSIEFTGALGHADQPQLACSALSGVGFCESSTTTPGGPGSNEVQKLEFTGFSPGKKFSLRLESSLLISACTNSNNVGEVSYSDTLAADVLATLEADCGANFATALTGVSATVTFTNALGISDQPQLGCAVNAGTGACAVTTSEAGGQAKPFERLNSIAVDPAGAVYVSDFLSTDPSRGEIHKYLSLVNPPTNADNVADFPSPRTNNLAAGTGPTAGFLFASVFGGALRKLDSSSGELQYVVPSANAGILAIDPVDGHLFSVSELAVNEYDASGSAEATLLTRLNLNQNIQGIAVAGGDLYLSRSQVPTVGVWERVPLPEASSEAATAIGGETALLHGTVSAAGGRPASCEFQYTTEVAFDQHGFRESQIAKCSPEGPFTGTGDEAVSAQLGELHPGTTYRFRVVAESVAGSDPERGFHDEGREGALSFRTLGPAIAEEAVSEIGDSTARISAQVNPNEEETVYAVEYVSDAKYRKSGYNDAIAEPVPPEALGAGSEPVAVSRELTELTPATTYHARIYAANSVEVHGPDHVFTTYETPPPVLPDGRAYEMVSPAAKLGEVLPLETTQALGGSCSFGECLPGPNSTLMPMQSSPDGDSVVYTGQPFSTGLSSGPNEYLSGRSAEGWATASITPLLAATLGVSEGYKAFSPDLSRAILYQGRPPALASGSPVDGEGRAYANLYLRVADGTLTPLVGQAPPHRSARIGTDGFKIAYGNANAGTGAVAPLSHVVFAADDALTAAVPGVAPAAPAVAASSCAFPGESCDLYEWKEGGGLGLLNVLPGNTAAAAGAVLGSGMMLAESPTHEGPAVDGAVSNDGRRVFWTNPTSGKLYARIDGQRTVEATGADQCRENLALSNRACFLLGSADGSEALLSDGQLYALNEAGSAYEAVADLTAGEGGFEGILGAARDLSRVYFVDSAVLSGGEANANGEAAEAGAPNLYAFSEGTTTFIGRLLAGDNNIAGFTSLGDWLPWSSGRTAQVSLDGRYLAFMSQARLTGYDNTRKSGAGCGSADGRFGSPACFEVFEYDAKTGKLSCASCNPSGARPLGKSNLSLIWPGQSGFAPLPQPGNLTSEGQGRLFFESQDTLSPHDTNGGIQDVYEWEPEGVGGCESEADEGGCVYLISSGHDSEESMFLNSTPSGNDAFVITRERLLPSDRDDLLDLYDARVDGGFEEVEEVPCEAEACKGPVTSPPVQPVSGTSGFHGPSNPTPAPRCPKGKVRRQGKCTKPHARHRKHRRHGNRAAKHKRGGSK